MAASQGPERWGALTRAHRELGLPWPEAAEPRCLKARKEPLPHRAEEALRRKARWRQGPYSLLSRPSNWKKGKPWTHPAEVEPSGPNPAEGLSLNPGARGQPRRTKN